MDYLVDIPTARGARYKRVMQEVELHFGQEAAAKDMQTRNLALGGFRPDDLVATEEGTRQVLAEISAHAEGGPL